jgi:hypothetical protein
MLHVAKLEERPARGPADGKANAGNAKNAKVPHRLRRSRQLAKMRHEQGLCADFRAICDMRNAKHF